MIQTAEIEQMSLEERLQMMELLWASLVRSQDAIPSPEWHGQVLEDRVANAARGETEFLTLEEVKSRLRKQAP